MDAAFGWSKVIGLIVARYSASGLAENKKTRLFGPALSWKCGLVLGGLIILLVWLGVYPAPVLRLIQQPIRAVGWPPWKNHLDLRCVAATNRGRVLFCALGDRDHSPRGIRLRRACAVPWRNARLLLRIRVLPGDVLRSPSGRGRPGLYR